jgi:hypothetical protein
MIKKSSFTKFAVGFLALATILSASSVSAAYNFTTNLKQGSKGEAVKELQKALNLCADTQVAGSGVGSMGMETSTFGPATKQAVMKFQAKHGITPAIGNFYPLTRAKMNATGCGGSTMNLPAGCTSTAGFSPVTGASCATTVSTGLPAGCSSTVGFSSITGASCATGTVAPQTGSVTAMLATTNPAAGIIVQNQATANLAEFTFTGSGTVNSVTLKRTGFSDQNTLTNVYLYDGVTRLTDGYSFNNNGEIMMNGLGLAVNGSKTISVKADVGNSTNAPTGQTLAISLAAFTAGTSVNTVGLSGNTMSVASGSTLASIGISGANSVSASGVNAGTSSYTVWRQAFQVNTRALALKAMNLRVTGSAPADTMSNVGLYVDGVKSGNNATMVMVNGSSYLSFDMSGMPTTLNTGTHTLEVRGDIVKGSSYSFTVSLQQASDLMVMDPQVGVNVAVCGNTSCSTSFSASTAGTISIGTGSFTAVVDSAFSTSTNVTAGASNVTIAKYKIKGYGEDIKVTSIPVTPVMTFPSTTYSSGTVTAGSQAITVASTSGFAVGNVITIAGATATVGTITSITSGTVMQVNVTTAGATPAGAVTLVTNSLGLQNVTLYFNGSQVGSQQGWTSGPLTYNLGSQMIIPAGVDSVLEVKADLRTSVSGTNYTGGTVAANLGAATAEGWNSKASITGPTATGTVLSLQSGNLAVSANAGYASQNANPNTAGVKIGSYVLQNQSTSESVRVTTLLVNVAYGAGTSSANLSGLRTSETTGNAGTPVQPATAAASSNANNTFSSDFTLAPGAVKTIDIFADSSSSAGATATVDTTLTVTSIGTTSNVSATSSAITGQTIAFRTGTLGTPTITTSGSTAAQLIAAASGGSADGSLAVYNFVSSNASSTITELTFTVTSGTATSIKVGNVTAPVVAGTAYLTGLNIAVPNGGSGVGVNVYVSYAEVGSNGIASNTSSTLTLTTIKSTSGNTTTTSSVTVAAPTMTLVGSKPTVAVNTSTASGLNMGGENKIGQVTVTADAKGNIKLNDIKFAVVNVGFTTNPTFTAAKITESGNSTAIAGSSCGQGTAAAATQVIFCEFGTSGNTFTTTTGVAGVEVNTDFDGYTITAGASKTFDLYATVSAANTGTNLAQISTSLNAAGFNWDDATYAQFVADASAASPSAGTNLTGSSIYSFPTGSYTIKQ